MNGGWIVVESEDWWVNCGWWVVGELWMVDGG